VLLVPEEVRPAQALACGAALALLACDRAPLDPAKSVSPAVTLDEPAGDPAETPRHRAARLLLRRSLDDVCACLKKLPADYGPARPEVTLHVATDGRTRLSSPFDQDADVAACLAELTGTWRLGPGDAVTARHGYLHCDAPAMAAIDEDACAASALRLANELVGADDCTTDADCVVVATDAAALGCVVYARRAAPVAEIAARIRAHERACGPDSPPCPHEDAALMAPVCRDGRCQRFEHEADRIAHQLRMEIGRAALRRLRACASLGLSSVKLRLDSSGTSVLAVSAHDEGPAAADSPLFLCVKRQVAGVRLPAGARGPNVIKSLGPWSPSE
jgi:hypothetical protein